MKQSYTGNHITTTLIIVKKLKLLLKILKKSQASVHTIKNFLVSW